MGREFHPILLENLGIRWSGFRIRRVALNQHMPRVERFSEHVHRYHQVLVYLRGSGVQHLGPEAIPVQRGSVLVIPPGLTHRFEKSRSVRPICLAIDFETPHPVGWHRESVFGARDLAAIERWLVALHSQARLQDPFAIQTAILILRILGRIDLVVGGGRKEERGGPVTASLRKLLERRGIAGITAGQVAVELNRTLDHLNRQLQSETGLSVGRFLSQARLERCCEFLRMGDENIGEIASRVGFDDQNYFTRWFRKQTGQTPTHWRAAMKARD
jgi:AraC family transcriptional regulator, transcriptional activator of pobA